jgi:glycosyltransferase involved in cell wall biosynthesis
MRILFVNHNVAWTGGTFFRAFHLGQHLARSGHSVTLFTISAKRKFGYKREICQGVEIIHFPDWFLGVGRSGWDPWDTMNRIIYLIGQAWDIVHAWDCRPAVIFPALFARCQANKKTNTKTKLVIDWCDWFGRGGTQDERPYKWINYFFGSIETYFEEAFRTKADGTTVISRTLFKKAIRLGVKHNTIIILPQGCDLDENILDNRFVTRTRLGINSSIPLLLYTGTLMPADADLLFASLRLIFMQRKDLRMVITGKNTVSIPRDLRSSSQLTIAGFVSKDSLRDYMSACDALFMPMADNLSNRARWPSRVNPFLAAGRTVILSSIGDLSEILLKANAGLIVNSRPYEIAAAILDLFTNPHRLVEYEQRALQVAKGQLNWKNIATQLETFYKKLIER